MPWSRKKVVSALESGLIVSLIVSGSPLFFISRSAVNSPSTSHLIVTIPNRQFASVWNRSGDSARVVGNPSLTGLLKGSPSLGIGKSLEHRTWLYIHHRRGYFSIYESYKLGVHEQSSDLRADLWLRFSAVLFGSSEFNRRICQLARRQAANGCRSRRSPPVRFRRFLARCGRSHPHLGLIVSSRWGCVCGRGEDRIAGCRWTLPAGPQSAVLRQCVNGHRYGLHDEPDGVFPGAGGNAGVLLSADPA